MKGHVRKRGTTWSYKHELPRDPVTGKRRSHEKTGFRTKRDAERALTESLARLHRGQHLRPERTTLGEYLEEWLPGYLRTVRASTAARNTSIVRAQLVPRIGHARLQDLRPLDLERFYGQLLDGDADYKPLTTSSIRSIHGVLSRALSDAERDERIARNPTAAARIPRGVETPRAASSWTPEEARAFLAAVDGTARHALWHTIVHTGMRRGEALGLKWSDLDLDTGHLTVSRQLVAASHAGELGDVKSAAGRRTIEIDASTVALLRRHKAEQNRRRLAAGPVWVETDLVFCAEDGRAQIPRSVSARFRKDVAAAGVRRIRLHDMRHTHASMLVQANVQMNVVQERLGHRDVRTTLGTYSHVLPGMQRDAADKFASLMQPESDPSE